MVLDSASKYHSFDPVGILNRMIFKSARSPTALSTLKYPLRSNCMISPSHNTLEFPSTMTSVVSAVTGFKKMVQLVTLVQRIFCQWVVKLPELCLPKLNHIRNGHGNCKPGNLLLRFSLRHHPNAAPGLWRKRR